MGNTWPIAGKSGQIDRRLFLQGAVATACLASTAEPLLAQANSALSDWGWPKDRQQISAKSIEFMKSKGWWPMRVAWNPNWSDGNAVLFAMQHYKLLEARGIEVIYPTFLAAGLMNEAFIPGTVQIAQAGSLGLLRLIDLNIPTAAVAAYPAQRSAFLVPPASPLKSPGTATCAARVPPIANSSNILWNFNLLILRRRP